MKKRKPIKHNPATQEKELFNAFVERLKLTCDRMAGKGVFEQLPNEHLPRLFEQRLPPLKLEFASGQFNPEQVKEIEAFFRIKMSGRTFKTLPGEDLPLADYFREGLLLVAFFKKLSQIRQDLVILPVLIGAYQTGSEWFFKAVDSIMHFMNTMCIVYSDPSKRILAIDYSKTTLLSAKSFTNKIGLSLIPVLTSRIKLDGHFRNIFPLSWSGIIGDIEPIMVKPAAIGFADVHDQPVQVYLQQHALARLIERMSLSEGMLLYMLDVLFRDEPTGLLFNNSQLVLLKVGGKKLGYMVTELVDNNLIIVTFLFLTNNGTPEGQKLAELTRLKMLDKQYLGIDTLEGVNSLRLSEDTALSELFTEAGCADLLDLTVFHNFGDLRSKGVDAEMVLKYLQNSPFMQRKS